MKRSLRIFSLVLLFFVPITEGQKNANKYCSDYFLKLPISVIRNVIGGTFSKRYEFLHMVALGYGQKNNLKWLCGGTLITNTFVLTAAHCAEASEGPVKAIRVNSITLENPLKGYTDVDVQKIILHPRYESSSHYNDIALLKLARPVPDYVTPACLHTTTGISSKTLTATGWGRTDFAGPTSNDLLKVSLRTFTRAQCSPFYKNAKRLPKGIDNKTQLCAGGTEKEIKDTCDGDSGGPLGYKKGRQYFITGITSFGKACGLARVPAVYTRVSAYVPWIESIVWK